MRNGGDAVARLVAEADTGGRKPVGRAAGFMATVAIVWSLFQLWIASPLPFSLGVFVLNDSESRAIHLAFAVFLGFAAYPAFKSSPRERIPPLDWLLGLAGAFCAGYLFLFYDQLASRPGLPSTLDLAVALAGLALLLEAARRALGLPLVILALLVLGYIFLGPHMPDLIAHRGASLAKGMSHLWLSTEGVFGIALGVSAGFIFLFVLFGALLETAGAGNYFIQSALSLLGHLRGGPAKAAVAASAATGMISGSSIANVVTTGTFTIPLMKRVGYRPDQAAAVEVAASVDGQLMPPVMGAAAFLMVEYVGIPYTEVLKHALLPALLSYIALFYIVHLEAMKAGLSGIPRRQPLAWQRSLINATLTISGVVLFAALVYYGFGWIKQVAGDASLAIVTGLMFATYIGLIAYAARFPAPRMDDPKVAMDYLPEIGPTLKSGPHFLLPVAALIWNLLVEQLSPALSAFWATLFLIFILLTQRPLFAFFRTVGCAMRTIPRSMVRTAHPTTAQFSLAESIRSEARRGVQDLASGLTTGARNMIAIGIATATAGIIVGAVTLTGIGLVMTDLVELVSGGNLMLMLIMVAVICLILGMGLPTTANYIVVSTLMAPVIVELGAQNGLLVPLIAVHLFVFYFGLMADVTPPVGLASYAAAGIARCDPIRAGVTAFGYSVRTAILPFMFIFNTQLLLIGIDSLWQLAFTVTSAILASLLFAAATQGWFITRNRLHETLLLLLIAFSLFRPGFWLDAFYPPWHDTPANQIMTLATQAPDQASLRMRVTGLDLEGREIDRGVLLPLGPKAENAQARLTHAGLGLLMHGDNVQIATVRFGSTAESLGLEPGFDITAVQLPADRPAKEWLYLPALGLLALVIWRQRERRGTT
jgi:TRAP transporter 4TM/12TM fusion protein